MHSNVIYTVNNFMMKMMKMNMMMNTMMHMILSIVMTMINTMTTIMMSMVIIVMNMQNNDDDDDDDAYRSIDRSLPMCKSGELHERPAMSESPPVSREPIDTVAL